MDSTYRDNGREKTCDKVIEDTEAENFLEVRDLGLHLNANQRVGYIHSTLNIQDRQIAVNHLSHCTRCSEITSASCLIIGENFGPDNF